MAATERRSDFIPGVALLALGRGVEPAGLGGLVLALDDPGLADILGMAKHADPFEGAPLGGFERSRLRQTPRRRTWGRPGKVRVRTPSLVAGAHPLRGRVLRFASVARTRKRASLSWVGLG